MPIPLVCPLMSRGSHLSCLEEYCAWWVKNKDEEQKGHCIIKDITKENEHRN